MSSEPRIVYAVTTGEYSDFGYVAIFDVQADAEAAQKAGLGDDVHEIKFYPADATPPKRVGFWRTFGRVDREGNHYVQEPHAQTEWTSTVGFRPPLRPQVEVRVHRVGTVVIVLAMTPEAATKAASDRVAQLLAEQMEPTDSEVPDER